MGRQGGREAREVGGANVASPQLKMLLVISTNVDLTLLMTTDCGLMTHQFLIFNF